jgi:hypothetical protein
MDSWYLSPELLSVITAANKNLVSLLKHNRKLETMDRELLARRRARLDRRTKASLQSSGTEIL